MTNNPTIDGVSRDTLTIALRLVTRELETLANGSAIQRHEAALSEIKASLAKPYHVVCSRGGILCQDSKCPECGGNGSTDIGDAPAGERQEPVEKVDHPNFLEFAICDTCAAESLCCEVAPNEHLCGGCYWAPINEKAHADQVAALQSTIARLEAKVAELESGQLTVWYGAMPESNGKTNWTAILHRKSDPIYEGCCITLDQSEYPERVRYEADRVRYLIGELAEEPFILDYDANKHSGYTPPPAPVAVVQFANELIDGAFEGGNFGGDDIQDIGVKHGLLSIETRDEPCGEFCACKEYGFPAECYRKTACLDATAALNKSP